MTLTGTREKGDGPKKDTKDKGDGKNKQGDGNFRTGRIGGWWKMNRE